MGLNKIFKFYDSQLCLQEIKRKKEFYLKKLLCILIGIPQGPIFELHVFIV